MNLYAGYGTLAENLIGFHEIAELPSWVQFDILNQDDDVLSNLQSQGACYHKQCSLQFNRTNLERARKSKRSTMTSASRDETETQSSESVQEAESAGESSDSTRAFAPLVDLASRKIYFLNTENCVRESCKK